jgi:hypothetical protein
MEKHAGRESNLSGGCALLTANAAAVKQMQAFSDG